MNCVGHGVSWGISRDFHLALPSSWEYTPGRFPLHGVSLETADFRLPIAGRHWKELPHDFFNCQSARRGGLRMTCHSEHSRKRLSVMSETEYVASGCCPLPRGEGGPRPALSPAGAGRVRGYPFCPQRELTHAFSTTFPPYANISFVFIYIPASVQSLPRSSFVFSNIPASSRHF
jgi:hypothetical protein